MKKKKLIVPDDYLDLLKDVSTLLEMAKQGAARSAKSFMTVIYWHLGRRNVEHK